MVPNYNEVVELTEADISETKLSTQNSAKVKRLKNFTNSQNASPNQYQMKMLNPMLQFQQNAHIGNTMDNLPTFDNRNIELNKRFDS